jgi:DNA-binding transcriptional LysR family regulator
MTGLEEGVRGPLNLAAITTAKYFMPHLLGHFLRDYPAVEPRLTITNQARVVERLDNNLDDLVIMGTVPESVDTAAAASPRAPQQSQHNLQASDRSRPASAEDRLGGLPVQLASHSCG